MKNEPHRTEPNWTHLVYGLRKYLFWKPKGSHAGCYALPLSHQLVSKPKKERNRVLMSASSDSRHRGRITPPAGSQDYPWKRLELLGKTCQMSVALRFVVQKKGHSNTTTPRKVLSDRCFFMSVVQQTGHTASRVIRLPRETPTPPGKALSNVCSRAAKYLVIRPCECFFAIVVQ